MKKKLFSLLLCVLMVFSYTGCTKVQKHAEHLEDYIFTLQYHDNFNILQLTDIHWSVNTSVRSSAQYLDKVLKEVNDHIVSSQGAGAGIDLVELTGDLFMLANLDSGAGFSETELSVSIDSDYIRPEQTDWFLKEHDLIGEDVPAIAYYHIPQDENAKAWTAVTEQGQQIRNKFFKLEGFYDNGKQTYESDFIDRAKKHNLKAAFMGHAHNVDWTFESDGVVIGLGVKTGKELYYAHIRTDSGDAAVQSGLASTGITEDFDLIGASLVTLTDTNGSFDLEHLYYNERKNGDFSVWVRW